MLGLSFHGRGPISKLGPTWKGLYGRTRSFCSAVGDVVADDDYIRESIQNPSAKIAPEFEKSEAAMPSYSGVLNDAQIESLILYLKTLEGDPPPTS